MRHAAKTVLSPWSQEAQSWHATFEMVAARMGITVAPASAMEHRVPGVAFRRLKAPATNICACVAAHDTRDLVQSFVQAARSNIKPIRSDHARS